jgi:hypothetical protein
MEAIPLEIKVAVLKVYTYIMAVQFATYESRSGFGMAI